MTTNERLALVREIVAASGDLSSLKVRLKEFSWDYLGEERVVLTRQDVASVLKRFCAGALSAADVELWANLLEGRDDVAYEVGAEDHVAEALDVLANPVLNGTLSIEAAKGLADKMS